MMMIMMMVMIMVMIGDGDDDGDDDDVFLRLQHGKGFYNLVYMSYVNHIKKGISNEHNNGKH
jgi:hypothetical protein